MWTVLLHPRVRTFLDKQDAALRARLEDGLRKLRDDPLRFVEILQGKDALKFRIGDYRALLDIDRERRIVKVQVLDHRSRIYKR